MGGGKWPRDEAKTILSTLQHLLSYYSSSLLLVYGWITQASFPGHVGGARKWPENEATVLKIGVDL